MGKKITCQHKHGGPPWHELTDMLHKGMDSWSLLAKVVPAQRQIQIKRFSLFCIRQSKFGGPPLLALSNTSYNESNVLSLPTRVVQHPRRSRLDFPLDRICPVTNPKENLIGLKRTEIFHLQGKYNWDGRQPQSTRLSHFSKKYLALQSFEFEKPWGALCVQYRDLHG